MLDMSWGEVMVIGGVALIVIGPKDLPKALRTLGQITTKVRRMAGEFQSQFTEAMREAELDSVRKDLEAINRNVVASTSTGGFNPIETIRNELKGAVEAPVAGSTAGASALPIVPSSPELAIAADAADELATYGHAPAAPAEEIGAPPAIVAVDPTEHHTPVPVSLPVDLTGPGLEPMPVTKPAELGPREGERA